MRFDNIHDHTAGEEWMLFGVCHLKSCGSRETKIILRDHVYCSDKVDLVVPCFTTYITYS